MLHRSRIPGPRFALLLVLAFFTLALAGCGGKY
jgi:hypothetical protein